MKRRLIIRPQAEVDIRNAVLWYEQRQRGLGNEVLTEIRSAIKRALVRPKVFCKYAIIHQFIASWCDGFLTAFSMFFARTLLLFLP
jgi:hypothetical protein